MVYAATHLATPPTREAVDALPGTTVLEFGAPWCSHCIAAQGLIEQALQSHPSAQHIKIEDGKGQPLGRSYRVKLWPTLVVLRQGREVARTVRPQTVAQILNAIAAAEHPPTT